MAQGINTVDKKRLNRIFASYSPAKLVLGDVSPSITVVSCSYVRSQVLAKFPLYFDFGAGVSYSHLERFAVPNGITHLGSKILSLSVPVSLSYRMSFSNGKIHLSPYLGPYMLFNLYGDYNTDSYPGLYSKETYCPIRFGCQCGVAFSYRILSISAGYAMDLTKYIDTPWDNRVRGLRLSIGFVF